MKELTSREASNTSSYSGLLVKLDEDSQVKDPDLIGYSTHKSIVSVYCLLCAMEET